ncbi:MAG: thiaminase/transcriptional activator TenA [Candidatus Promineifilaceae bacterium]|jgi:thiaminase/transcriptional activator TenA
MFMSFSRKLITQAEPYMQSQVKKPFLQGLINGTLPTESFQYWLRVDYPYLQNFLKVCSLGVLKADDPQDTAIMLQHVAGIQDEMVDHEKHAASLNLTRDDLLSFPMGPLKYSYTRHQLASAYHGSLGDVQAAILACQWGYGEAVIRLKREKPVQPDNPYVEWFAFHGDPVHRKTFEEALDLLDRQAAKSTEAQQAQMAAIFFKSVQHETMLWDEYFNMTLWETYPLVD